MGAGLGVSRGHGLKTCLVMRTSFNFFMPRTRFSWCFPKEVANFCWKKQSKTVFIRCSHSAIFASVLWVLGTKVPRSYRLLNLATVTVLFPVPGHKSMRQRNLSPDQKVIRVCQLLLKSFQETNRSAGLGGGSRLLQDLSS